MQVCVGVMSIISTTVAAPAKIDPCGATVNGRELFFSKMKCVGQTSAQAPQLTQFSIISATLPSKEFKNLFDSVDIFFPPNLILPYVSNLRNFTEK